jgi:exodeoxyribonuclease VII large subunit
MHALSTSPPSAVWSVAALVGAISNTLATQFSAVRLQGEISGLTRASSGHVYLSLKDADGAGVLVRSAMFRRAASLLDFVPADGQRVEVRGRVAVYEPRGELQLVIESMQRAGVGALYEQFVQLRAKLQAQGLFDAQAKRPLPVFARSVGVVTSLGAAALRDVLTTLARRAPHVRVVIYPSLVQGVDAPSAIVQALKTLGLRGEVDAVILCRGGGSLEDLWAFNDERVVRAIAACTAPLVCGVGHETDTTLADLAADVRAATPTAAAELVVPSQAACMQTLQAYFVVLSGLVHRRLDTFAQRLDHAALKLRTPRDAVLRSAQRLAFLEQKMAACLSHTLAQHVQRHCTLQARMVLAVKASHARHVQRVAHLAARLESLGPQQVLSRGYAWLHSVDNGQPLVSVAQLHKGQQVQVVLADGHADVSVRAVHALLTR